MHTIFLLVGESGSGKDTICSKLVEKYNYKQVLSYTTRKKRNADENTHIFIQAEEVDKYIDQMIAYTKFDNHEYFATVEQLKNNDLYVIDPFGVEYLHSRLLELGIDNIKVVTIYINVSEADRESRMTSRGDSQNKVYGRLEHDKKAFFEFKANALFDYSVCNKDINISVNIIKYIIELERSCNEYPYK